MKFTFFKIPSHRRFNIEPIYYDEAKAKRQERERRIREELGIDHTEGELQGSFEDRVRGKMKRRMKTHFEVTRSARRKSNLRLIIILITLMALVYYLLQTGYDWYSKFL
jgi:hypothetical protein